MTVNSRPNGVALQERDLSLIRMLAEDFRILTGTQIDELLPMGSEARRNSRLKQLRDAGYLSVRVVPGMSGSYGYFIGPKGHELFADATEQQVVRRTHVEAANLSPNGLPHRILVDSIHIRFLTAAREYPNYRLLTWIDQYSPSWGELRQYGVPVQADGYGEYLMLLHYENLFTFFLEADRDNERGRAIQDKLDRYREYAQSGTYETQFAARPFRVLIVTTSARRLQWFLRTLAGNTPDIFWITTWDRFRKSKLLEPYWLRPGREDSYPLL